MSFITFEECAKYAIEECFRVNNFELLSCLAFIALLSLAWLFVYSAADSLSKEYGEKKIQKLLYNIDSVIAWFCAGMMAYILIFK